MGGVPAQLVYDYVAGNIIGVERNGFAVGGGGIA